ncbi:tetratricopeptide repeat protein [Variovorax sp. SG517]|uniref:tetratricopeptide repeat protein n=1 Tax=unclassified Variovorax TaxID=663243 RepID=UPI00159CF7F5|nr:hypothetical protein [Variovorax sp. SG517]NVM90651.1 hypothetical protein [Variovorax sp. SG517]
MPMLFQRLLASLAFTVALAFGMLAPALAKTATPAAAAAKEPTIQQIYEAASNGKMADADAMIAKVLKNHPKSAKARYVHAELLAMKGELDDARDELALAKELSPGLKFAKAESVAKLERKLEKPVETKPEPPPVPSPAAALASGKTDTGSSSGPIPWGPIGIVALFVVAYVVFQQRRRATTFEAPVPAGSGTRFSRPTSDSSMGYGRTDDYRDYGSAPPAPSQGPGIGGALAAGAAAGVGAVVAGELLRHMMNDRSDEHRGSTVNIFNTHRGHDSGNDRMGSSLWPTSDPEPERQVDRSFVDNDFGISDTSSWDDSSSSSSSDSGSSDSSSSSSSSDW